MKRILSGARSASPYLLVELLLPGGTLIALLMWLYYRRRDKKGLTPIFSTDVQT
jgi:hypothetical protein